MKKLLVTLFGGHYTIPETETEIWKVGIIPDKLGYLVYRTGIELKITVLNLQIFWLNVIMAINWRLRMIKVKLSTINKKR